jgi:O-acetyl-ADP-ribose deacetylase (regulator of RNase III)
MSSSFLSRKKVKRLKIYMSLSHIYDWIGVGEVAILLDSSRSIFYLVTKQRYFHKPTYDTLRDTLKELCHLCTTHAITELAMPRIGCGLDQLQWQKVKEMIIQEFQHTPIQITVYNLPLKK